MPVDVNEPTAHGLAADLQRRPSVPPVDETDEGDRPEALIGQVIAERYRVDAVLGSGGMGAVFRCHHLGLLRDLAVKVLHPQMGKDRELAARFAREAQSASRLDHPNCVRVLDFGAWSPSEGAASMQYLAMELLQGHELTDALDRPLPPLRAVDLMLQILRGLEHAHERGIVHRDLKPENVFVTTDHAGGELLKIVDFGIAKITSGEGSRDNMTKAGFIFGTPRYMSPEQCLGLEIDSRADIYAAGVMLYQMLAGQPPFDHDDLIVVVRQHVSKAPPPLPDTVPTPLRDVVEAMLVKEREARLPDAPTARRRLEAVRDGLLAEQAGMAAAAATPTFGMPAVRQATAPAMGELGTRALTLMGEFAAPQRRRTWLMALGGVATLGILLAWAPWSDDEAPSPGETPAAAVGFEWPSLGERAPSVPRASVEALKEIDGLLANGDARDALERVRMLLDQYPDDPQLLVRKGRSLAGLPPEENQAAPALEAYRNAMEQDPALLDDEALRAELTALMGRPELVDAALDLAIRRLGEHGKPFLLARVNDEAQVLGYVNRHRALDRLAELEASDDVDAKLNLALELWQAPQSPDPCKAYGEGLTAIENEPDAYYIGTLMRTTPPVATEKADAVHEAVCAVLPARLDTIRKDLLERYQTPEAQWVVPKAYASKGRPKKKRRRNPFRGLFR